MDALLIKTGGLLLIVALGYLLKRRGVFQPVSYTHLTLPTIA